MLKDASKRQTLDNEIRTKLARKERYAAHDSKRKALIDELEESERNSKRQRSEQIQAQRAEASDIERIQAENKRIREGRGRPQKSEPLNPPVPVLGTYLNPNMQSS